MYNLFEILKTNCSSITPKLLYEDLKKGLTEEQLIIIKYKLEGYKNTEIARKLKVCPATITKRMFTIKKKIKRYFKDGFK